MSNTENSLLGSPHKIRKVDGGPDESVCSDSSLTNYNGKNDNSIPVSVENAAPACNWQEIELPTDWGTIRGKKCGEGDRKILCVHGWLDNANSFDVLIPALGSQCTFVSIDLPGHGRSDHFNNGFVYDPRGYLGAIKKAVNVLGWTKFSYLGHSMGAVVGILYAAIFPDDLDSFISIDIIKPWSSEEHKYPEEFRKYFSSYFSNEHKRKLPPIVYSEELLISKTIEGTQSSLDVASAKILLERGAEACPGGYILKRDLRAKSYFIGFMTLGAWIAMAEEITCPILMIKAKSGKIYESPANYSAMLAAFERGSAHYRYHELEGKHHVHMTHAPSVAEVLRPFLQDTERFCSVIPSNGSRDNPTNGDAESLSTSADSNLRTPILLDSKI